MSGKKRSSPKRDKVIGLLKAGGMTATEIANKVGCTSAYVRLVSEAMGKDSKLAKASKAPKKRVAKKKAAKKPVAKKKKPYKKSASAARIKSEIDAALVREVKFRLVKVDETIKKGELVITSTYQIA